MPELLTKYQLNSQVENHIISEEDALNTTFSTISTDAIFRHSESYLMFEVFNFHYENLCNSFMFVELFMVNKALINPNLPINM